MVLLTQPSVTVHVPRTDSEYASARTYRNQSSVSGEARSLNAPDAQSCQPEVTRGGQLLQDVSPRLSVGLDAIPVVHLLKNVHHGTELALT